MNEKMGHVYIYLLVVICFVEVRSLSTHDKTDHLKYHKFYKQSAHPFTDCRDTLNATTCKKLEPYCHEMEKLHTVCKRTCGLCPAVSPMSCHLTPHGCCWDNITEAGVNGDDCPACEDKTTSCYKFYDQCHLGHIRRACPITCEVRACLEKGPNCFDDTKQAQFCPIFKESGFCKFDPSLMQIYCRKTCDLCDKVPVVHPMLVKHAGGNPPREAGGNPPREAVNKIIVQHIEEEKKKNVIQDIEEEAMKKDSSSSVDDDKLQELLEEESMMQKKELLPIKKKSPIKTFDDQYLKMLETLSNKDIEKEITNAKRDAPTKKKEVKSDESAVASLEKIGLVKDELEKKTEDLLNDLIQDTLAQQKQKKEKVVKNDEDPSEIAKLEASLLDMLLKERSKKST